VDLTGASLSGTQVSLCSLPVIAITVDAPQCLSCTHVACRSPDSRGNVKDAKNYSVFKVQEGTSFSADENGILLACIGEDKAVLESIIF
jgi:hypothetical protein